MPTAMHSNPYKTGKWVNGINFYGRETLIRTLLQQDGELVWLIGNRKVGKTSVLRELQREALATGRYGAFFLELTAATSLDDWTYCLREAIESESGVAALKKIGAPVTLPEGLDFFTLQRHLMFLANQAGYKLLLLCDEAENLIETAKSVPHLVQRLRKEWTLSPDKLNVVVAATKRLWQLADYDNPLTSPLITQFVQHAIAQISDAEANALIEQSRNPNGGVDVSPQQRDSIRSYTGNHPYLIQNLCQKLYDPTRNCLRAITPADLVLEPHIDYGFAIDYESLTASERCVLLELEQLARVEDLEQRCGLPSPVLAKTLRMLETLGFIRRYGAVCAPSNYFLHQWLIGKKKSLKAGPALAAHLSSSEIEHLSHLLAELRANMRLIEERESQYILETDIPLDLVKARRRLQSRVDETIIRLEEAGVLTNMAAIPAARLSRQQEAALQAQLDQIAAL